MREREREREREKGGRVFERFSTFIGTRKGEGEARRGGSGRRQEGASREAI